MKRNHSIVITLLFYIALNSSLYADASTKKTYQALPEIQTQVYNFILSHINNRKNYEILVSPLDSRLKLIKCEIPLDINNNKRKIKSGVLSISVRCNGEKKWSLRNRAKLTLYKNVLILQKNLPRNTEIQQEHIKVSSVAENKLRRGYFTHYKQIKGQLTHRRLKEGTIIRPFHLRPPQLIKKGEQIIIKAHSASFNIQMPGIALMNGQLGDQISVKNLNSNKIIKGKITSMSTVTVY